MQIVIRAAVMFFFVWFLTRSMGKKELSDVSVFEMILLIVMVMVPASMVRRVGGQAFVASLVGSPGSPMVSTSRQLSGRRASAWMRSSNR